MSSSDDFIESSGSESESRVAKRNTRPSSLKPLKMSRAVKTARGDQANGVHSPAHGSLEHGHGSHGSRTGAVSPKSPPGGSRTDLRRELDKERERLMNYEAHHTYTHMELFQLYREVECAIHELNISGFENPEIVVVGMQSDGKSSFVEAMMGFQFNMVHSTIGTRRPLIIQMINDSAMKVPHCVFRRENVPRATLEDEQEAGGPQESSLQQVAHPDDTSDDRYWEKERVAVRNLSAEISRRTSTVAGADKSMVSAKPIILRVRFAHCANLTIIDTPGFRLGGDPKLSSDIDRMVVQLLKPKHRIIVCLEQSSVEWANSTSRPLVQRVDPELKRTVLVISKIDNRLKELNSEQEAKDYFESLKDYLPLRDDGTVKAQAFFVSLPVRRDYDETEYKEALRKTYLVDYKKLLQLGVHNHPAVANAFGIFKVRHHLEQTLIELYRQKLQTNLRILAELSQKTRMQLTQLQQELAQKEPPIEALRERVVTYVEAFCGMLVRLLNGSVQGDPDRYGQTLVEEKEGHEAVRDANTGALLARTDHHAQVHAAELKVYGGAQYRRVLEEFLLLTQHLGLSFKEHVTASQVASSLGFSSPSAFALEKAAIDIVQCKAGGFLRPLTDNVVSRVAYVIKRLFPIAMQCIPETAGLVVYPNFLKELSGIFDQLIDSVVQLTREKIDDDFQALVASIDAATILSANPQLTADPTPVDASDPHLYVCETAHRLFNGVKHMFSHSVRAKMNHFFLLPIIGRLNSGEIIHHFRTRQDQVFHELFSIDTADIREQVRVLSAQNERLSTQYKRFQHLFAKF